MVTRNRSCQKFEYDIEEFKEYAAWHSTKEIAERYGISIRTARKHAGMYGLTEQNAEKNVKQHEEAVSRLNEKLERIGSTIRYVDGTTKKESATFKCVKCGHVFTRLTSTVKRGKCTSCPRCKEVEAKNASDARKADKEAALLDALAKPIKCAECGKEFYQVPDESGIKHKTPKYCSDKCKRKSCGRASRHRRREMVKTAGTFSWQSIYEKTGGTCWICGGKVDPSDYEIRDGAFCVGAKYPSVDHVVPISLGGKSTYDNMLLAHCMCNSLRGVG